MKKSVLTALTAISVAAAVLPATPASAVDNPLVYPYLMPVGDLDGDGLNDLLGFSRDPGDSIDADVVTIDPQATSRLVITALKGSTGTPLWDYEFSEPIGDVVAANVGTDGAPGLIIYSYEMRPTGPFLFTSGGYESPWFGSVTGASEVVLTVTALSGTGTQAWEKTFDPGTFVYPPNGNAYVDNLALFQGTIAATPSAADDVLVSVYNRTPTPDGQDDQMQGLVLDGSNGQTTSTSTLDIAGAVTTVTPAGDLSGDGQDDYTVRLEANAEDVVEKIIAVDGVAGTQLWSKTMAAADSLRQTKLGDVTGDGRDDLAFGGEWWTPSDLVSPDLFIVDGATGAFTWTTQADYVRATEDQNGDGVSDLLVAFRESGSNFVGVVYQVSSATGGFITSTPYDVTFVGTPDSKSISTRESVGDVDGDGVQDLAHEVTVADGASDQRVVSGVDGETIRTGSYDQPLLASVDGTGNDFYNVRDFGKSVRDLTITDGSTGDVLWMQRLRPTGTSTDSVQVVASDVTGDGRAEVIVIVLATDSVTATVPAQGTQLQHTTHWQGWVLDGRNGATLWSFAQPPS